MLKRRARNSCGARRRKGKKRKQKRGRRGDDVREAVAGKGNEKGEAVLRREKLPSSRYMAKLKKKKKGRKGRKR